MANNNNTKNLNVPNLRFPEFKGEWKKYKVSDILEFFPTNSLSWDQLEYGTDNIYNLHYGLIHKGLPTQIELVKCSLPNIKKELIPKNYTLCKDGDVAFADASEDTNDVGKVVEFLSCENKNIICGLHTIHGRDKKNLTINGFKGYAFSSEIFRCQIRRLSQGTKIYSISPKNFKDISIGVPSKEEQSKIAALLWLLDHRIATQNKIIEKYESLIKGIRYYILEESTHYNYLGNLCNIIKGQQVNLDNLLKHGKYYVMNGGTQPSGYYNSYNTDAGTISISEGGNSCGYVQYNKENFWSGGHCYTLQNIKSELTEKYLYHYLKSNEKMIMALRVGSGLPNIQKKDLMSLRIPIPTKENQKKISCLLDSIEDKISVETNVLKYAIKQKSYLLRQMFI
ncbi:restriction endonuclease subunit S [Bacteroides xylanisolvens]|uniref:Restriction endonuclease subunit S n=1 Tax=Bacteroides xylanisolvens TaxID=371601 RepID=A0A415KCM8_9BACE|nr:restriction endonuclease subunit S [Bacteroides xylanisolvens]RHL34027.1 restriction endonuclease subunit S [Bacteroides xylanisolvens]